MGTYLTRFSCHFAHLPLVLAPFLARLELKSHHIEVSKRVVSWSSPLQRSSVPGWVPHCRLVDSCFAHK
uniref:Secreted protein n=1 Tax=Setaria italica TaxID=4555 RepID=K3XTI7_SETIT